LKYHGGGLKNCLSWVICGGESGHHARPVNPDGVRSLRNQCQAAQVPFFFQQLGEGQEGSCIKDHHYKGKHIYMLNDGQAFDFFPKEGIVDIKTVPAEYWNKHNATVMAKVGKHKSGNLLDGKKHEEYPSFDSAQDDEII